MNIPRLGLPAMAAAAFLALLVQSCATSVKTDTDESQGGVNEYARQTLDEGRKIFRFDTFGSEAFWTKTRLHEAIAGEKNGGVGGGVSPNTALKLGLKVDVTA